MSSKLSAVHNQCTGAIVSFAAVNAVWHAVQGECLRRPHVAVQMCALGAGPHGEEVGADAGRCAGKQSI